MKKIIFSITLSFTLFLGLAGTVLAKSYTSEENFKIKSFGGYTLSTQSKNKTKTCNYGYFKLTSRDTATFKRYCIFVTEADTSDPITNEIALSKSTSDETRITYKTNYKDMKNKTIKAKVRGASLEPSAGSLIRGKFSPDN